MTDTLADDVVDLIEIHDPGIDVEAILRRIREDVARLKDESAEWPSYGVSSLRDVGEADLNAQMQRAITLYAQLDVPMIIARRGRLSDFAPWAALRRAAHELVVFYVNALARKQTLFNAQVVHLLNRLISRDATRASQTEVAQLRERVQRLEQRLAELESQLRSSRGG
jgi:hypothetical protein